MKEWIISRAMGLVLPVVLGPIAYVVTQWLKKSIAALDAASPRVKQAVVIALSFLLAGAVKYVGSYLPPLCSGGSDAVGCLNAVADPQAMQVMLSALFAYALHAARGKQQV
jgi:succinate dehydrogenase hydrophobic anchor subunit